MRVLLLAAEPEEQAAVARIIARVDDDAEVVGAADLHGLEQALAANELDAVVATPAAALAGAGLRLVRQRRPDLPVLIVTPTAEEAANHPLLAEGATEGIGRDQLERLPRLLARAVAETRAHRRARIAEAAKSAAEKQALQQAQLARLALRALEAPRLEPLLESAARTVAEGLDLPCCEVLRLDETGGRLEVGAAVGWRPGQVPPAIDTGSGSFHLRALAAPVPVALPDLQAESVPPYLAESGVQSSVVSAVAGPGRSWGILAAHSRERREFSRDELEFLHQAANVLAVAAGRDRAVREQERLTRIVEESTDLVGMAHLDGTPFYLNPAGRRLLGLGSDEPLPAPITAFHPGWARRTLVEQAIPAALSEGAWRGETAILTRDGREIPVSQLLLAHFGEDGAPVHLSIVIRDVSDRQRLDSQLRESERLAALASFATGVARDLDHLVSAIGGYSGLALAQGGARNVRRCLDEIQRAGEQASNLTRQLLAFGGRLPRSPRVLSLNDVIGSCEGLLRRMAGEEIALEVRLAPDLGHVRADPTEVEVVLVNLVVHAREVMPYGGSLTIATENVDLDQAYLERHLDAQPGRHALLSVRDNGMGMDAATQRRLFEPFLPARSAAGGGASNLGLATVHGIVAQNGGHIAVHSETGVGTTFRIYLPRVNGSS